MHNEFKTWQALTFKGKKFLALDNSRQVHIYGENFVNYGTYRTLESFKKMYDEQGENLRLE